MTRICNINIFYQITVLLWSPFLWSFPCFAWAPFNFNYDCAKKCVVYSLLHFNMRVNAVQVFVKRFCQLKNYFLIFDTKILKFKKEVCYNIFSYVQKLLDFCFSKGCFLYKPWTFQGRYPPILIAKSAP